MKESCWSPRRISLGQRSEEEEMQEKKFNPKRLEPEFCDHQHGDHNEADAHRDQTVVLPKMAKRSSGQFRNHRNIIDEDKDDDSIWLCSNQQTHNYNTNAATFDSDADQGDDAQSEMSCDGNNNNNNNNVGANNEQDDDVDEEEDDIKAWRLLQMHLRREEMEFNRRLEESELLRRQQHEDLSKLQHRRQQSVPAFLFSQSPDPVAQANSMSPQSTPHKLDTSEVNLSFCGCGFLGIYHVGVASCFHEYAPQLSMHKISGSSAGALVAVSYICGNQQLAYCTTDILTVAIEARKHTIGPFHPSFDIHGMVREALTRGLPEDAYQKANGRLHVSLTRVDDFENVIINRFDSNEDLIQVLLCSCFIPIFSGLKPPKYKGVTYIDGGFSNNILKLDNNTVTVSPFSGEADICPLDDTLNPLQISLSNTSFLLSATNMYRLSHALLPPEPEMLSDLFKTGFADGVRYLQRMKLISCNKCIEIRSSLLVTTSGEDMEDVITAHHNNELNSDKHQELAHQSNSEDTHAKDSTSNTSNNNKHNNNIRLEQQEQEMIEIVDNPRRNSIVSIRSQTSVYHHRAQHQHQQTSESRTLTPSISLQNLLHANNLDESVLIEDDEDEDELTCEECVMIRQKALDGPLPEQFSDRIRTACDKVNKSLSKWIYSHRPVKYLSYLTLPYYLPIDLTLAMVYKCWKKSPVIRSELAEIVQAIISFFLKLLRHVQSKSMSSMLMDSSWQAPVNEEQKQQELTAAASRSRSLKSTDSTDSSDRSSLQEPVRQDRNPVTSSQKCGCCCCSSRCSLDCSHKLCIPNATSSGTNLLASSRANSFSVPTVGSHSNQQQQQQHQQQQQSQNGRHSQRELHSLEDTFDSIVDVTSKQEARIFAYYFRDAKNRLQVTEIFDHQRAAELNSSTSLNDDDIQSSTTHSNYPDNASLRSAPL